MERPTRMRVVLVLSGVGLLALAAGALLLGGRGWQLHARSVAYDPMIRQAALRHGVPASLVKAVIWKESRYRSRCVGRAQEMGLMQVTPGAVSDWCATWGLPRPSRAACFDPSLNIEIGTWYLGRALRTWKQYRSADVLALAEYNAGGARARSWAPANPQAELTPADVRLPSTRDYIAQVRRKWHDFERAQSARG